MLSVEFLPPAKEKVLNGCIFDQTSNFLIGILNSMSRFDVLQNIYVHQNVSKTKQKGIIFGKKLSRKFSNALFREQERYHGIKFLQTGEIYLNQS